MEKTGLKHQIFQSRTKVSGGMAQKTAGLVRGHEGATRGGRHLGLNPVFSCSRRIIIRHVP